MPSLLVREDNGIRELRMARVDEIVLLDHPADATGPRSIKVYLVDVQDFVAVDGKKYELDPQCLLYSLQWQHNGTPPDLHLQLVCDPELWFVSVAPALFSALMRHDPQLFDRLCAAAAV